MKIRILLPYIVLTTLANNILAMPGDVGRISAVNYNNAEPHLKLQLYKDAVNTDDTYIGFDANAKTQYVFNEDAPYFIGNGKINLASISSDNIKLAINRVPLPKQSETIKLYVNAAQDGAYKLNLIEDYDIPALYEVWLMDAYKKDSLEIRQYHTYTFNILKADTNSFGSARFSLVIHQNPALAFHLLDFRAVKAPGRAQISWKTENEYGYTDFTIERSTGDGTTYDDLDSIKSDSLGAYSYLDKTPLSTGVTKYRLKIQDLAGTISYSNVVTLTFSNTNINHNSISVYPNPASGIVNFSIAANDVTGQQTINGTSESYGIKIINLTGAVIKTATTSTQNWQTDVSNLLPGTYIIQVIKNGEGGIVGKGTFIKL